MARASKMRRAVVSAGIVAAFSASGLSGCALSALSTPSIADVETTVQQSIDDSMLKAPGTLTVAVDITDAPQVMSTDGAYSGYAVDVAKALASRLGVSCNIVDYASGLESADILIGASSTVSGDYALVGEYCEDATAIFGTGNGAISSDSLSGAVIGVQESSSSQDALNRAGISAAQKTYSSINACFDAMLSGEVGYVACDALSGAYLARVYDGAAFLGTLSSVSVENVYLVSSADGLSDVITTAFNTVSTDGTLSAIYGKWFGSLPQSLSNTLVSGVVIESAVDDSAGDSAATEEETADQAAEDGIAGTITDADINAIATE